MDVLSQLAADAPRGLNVFQAVGELLRQQPQVTIVKVAGLARGGGAEFIAAADIAYASRETARIGQVELIFTADAIDADTAAAYGWINRVIPAAELDDFVTAQARNIAHLPDGVIAAAKRVLRPQTPEEGCALEEAEWGRLIAEPAAAQIMETSLRAGAHTTEGERDLESILRHVHHHRNESR